MPTESKREVLYYRVRGGYYGDKGVANEVRALRGVTHLRDRGFRTFRNAREPRPNTHDAKLMDLMSFVNAVNLLDIGSGRGTGLTQVLLEFPELDIAAVECDEKLLPNLRALSRGLEVVRSTGSLSVYNVDATTLPFQEGEFDVGTALEVLEHIQDTQKAVNEIVRVCRKVVFSVPSEPDDNPEHVHLHTPADLRRMFFAAGAKRVTFDPVPGHTVGIAHVWE